MIGMSDTGDKLLDCNGLGISWLPVPIWGNNEQYEKVMYRMCFRETFTIKCSWKGINGIYF